LIPAQDKQNDANAVTGAADKDRCMQDPWADVQTAQPSHR